MRLKKKIRRSQLYFLVLFKLKETKAILNIKLFTNTQPIIAFKLQRNNQNNNNFFNKKNKFWLRFYLTKTHTEYLNISTLKDFS